MRKELAEGISKVDILSDFDGAIIKEQSQFNQALAYLKYLKTSEKPGFLCELICSYASYRKKRDVSIFYESMKGCPAEVLESLPKQFTSNEHWENSIKMLGAVNIGVISRGNYHLISRYLALSKNLPNSGVEIVAANIPEIDENGFYTGEVEILVNNGDLIDFVKRKDYICGREERHILSRTELTTKKIGHGLYICSAKKVFSLPG